MDVVYKYKPSIPYSLHDMRVNKIELAESRIRFYFEYGYMDIQNSCKQVDGNIRVEGVDFDFSYIHLLSENGQYGTFTGKKMEISEFIKAYPYFSFEIIDEMYGYNAVTYSGYVSLPDSDSLIDMNLSIYHTGNIVFELAE